MRSLPGFSAEAALLPTRRLYRTVTVNNHSDHGGHVMPQLSRSEAEQLRNKIGSGRVHCYDTNLCISHGWVMHGDGTQTWDCVDTAEECYWFFW